MKHASLQARIAILLVAMLGLHACSPHSPHPSQAEAREQLNSAPEVAALNTRVGEQLVFSKAVDDPALFTQKFRHTINDVEVIGSGADVHSAGQTQAVSTHIADVQISTVPQITSEQSKLLAIKYAPTAKPEGEPTLKVLPGQEGKSARLIYVIALTSGDQLWLDANDGSYIATISASDEVGGAPAQIVRSAKGQGVTIRREAQGSCEVAPIDSTNFQPLSKNECKKTLASSCQIIGWLQGLPQLFNPRRCEPATRDDPSAVRAAENSQKFLDYFALTHHRNSFDGRGATVISIVHAGLEYSNAVWMKKGQYIVYGDGDGAVYKDYTYGVDIAGHEFTHAVIQNTAGLVAMGQSGALAESLADFFGKMVEGAGDWNFGAQVMLGHDPNNAIRNLANPASLVGQFIDQTGEVRRRPYPASTAQAAPILEPCAHGNDFCGIHYNATIPGHAWYQIYESLGKERAESLLYLALTHYFSELTDFKGAAKNTLQACAQLYEKKECAAVKDIFVKAGMI